MGESASGKAAGLGLQVRLQPGWPDEGDLPGMNPPPVFETVEVNPGGKPVGPEGVFTVNGRAGG